VVPDQFMSPRHEKSARWLATWFGCGLAPVIPGTIGTLGAIPLVYAMQRLSPMGYLMATLSFTVFAVLVSQVYEVTVQEHDRPELVIDEVAGFLVSMAWIPFQWQWVLLAFLVFRALDMIKPWPISWVDAKIEGGVGAVADDLVAGVATNVLLQWLLQNGYLWTN
jgi:phosphatidylglycerophosphatase A